jgi:hypothetical protein
MPLSDDDDFVIIARGVLKRDIQVNHFFEHSVTEDAERLYLRMPLFLNIILFVRLNDCL